MEYFAEVENEDYEKEIVLLEKDRVFGISKCEDGTIAFREKCDDYYYAKYTKEQAILLLKEAIAWIESSQQSGQPTCLECGSQSFNDYQGYLKCSVCGSIPNR